MSAPETNIEKQERRHAGPLIGITACLVFAAIILVAYFGFIVTDDAVVEDGPVVTAPAD
ncbi:hypothetical protein [Jannaschia aquimarina]|uniref:Uncharacterized protein n=1 Tax=Jannaschia aquimarina TaxID=935700 RepID=A0A0D1EE59_9RHOB|nr:hypothetical protein [Jannaschia aquimarina]KIT15196.1 hypothetical protein jaqu_30990 [Jannaschia aquimarina]SNS85438.1 hypothetical protein SAMN05421775_10317 [Jannaschia aquimarina]